MASRKTDVTLSTTDNTAKWRHVSGWCAKTGWHDGVAWRRGVAGWRDGMARRVAWRGGGWALVAVCRACPDDHWPPCTHLCSDDVVRDEGSEEEESEENLHCDDTGWLTIITDHPPYIAPHITPTFFLDQWLTFNIFFNLKDSYAFRIILS